MLNIIFLKYHDSYRSLLALSCLFYKHCGSENTALLCKGSVENARKTCRRCGAFHLDNVPNLCIHWCIKWWIHWCIQWWIHWLIHWWIHWCIHWCIQWWIHWWMFNVHLIRPPLPHLYQDLLCTICTKYQDLIVAFVPPSPS